MHICVIQHDNRSDKELGNLRLVMDQNKYLCEKDSNCSHFENKSLDNKKPILSLELEN